MFKNKHRINTNNAKRNFWFSKIKVGFNNVSVLGIDYKKKSPSDGIRGQASAVLTKSDLWTYSVS